MEVEGVEGAEVGAGEEGGGVADGLTDEGQLVRVLDGLTDGLILTVGHVEGLCEEGDRVGTLDGQTLDGPTDGLLLGEIVFVGPNEGRTDGSAVGLKVDMGIRVGYSDGTLEEETVGPTDGCKLVGETVVGNGLGCAVLGTREDWTDGLGDGKEEDGESVGQSLGPLLGREELGEKDGEKVSATDGRLVGEAVGAREGTALGRTELGELEGSAVAGSWFTLVYPSLLQGMTVE